VGVSDKILALASSEGLPNPADVQHAKQLMRDLCGSEPTQKAERNLRLLQNAYLNIQMAKVCEDPRLMAASLQDFRRALSAARGGGEGHQQAREARCSRETAGSWRWSWEFRIPPRMQRTKKQAAMMFPSPSL
jgi:hypothetical protein